MPYAGHAPRCVCSASATWAAGSRLVAASAASSPDRGLRVLLGVGTGWRGSLLAPAGLSAAEVLGAARGPATFPDPTTAGSRARRRERRRPARRSGPPRARGGGATIVHLAAGLTHGIDAITVNKGPVTWVYRRLAVSRRRGRRLLFEGAVVDGCPVFSLFVPVSPTPGCSASRPCSTRPPTTSSTRWARASASPTPSPRCRPRATPKPSPARHRRPRPRRQAGRAGQRADGGRRHSRRHAQGGIRGVSPRGWRGARPGRRCGSSAVLRTTFFFPPPPKTARRDAAGGGARLGRYAPRCASPSSPRSIRSSARAAHPLGAAAHRPHGHGPVAEPMPCPSRPPTRSTPTCWPSTKGASRRPAARWPPAPPRRPPAPAYSASAAPAEAGHRGGVPVRGRCATRADP